MNKKYIVRLTKEERNKLEELTKKGKTKAYKIKHANILLNIDANDANRTDEETAKIFRCHSQTVRNIRQRFVERGLDAALMKKMPGEPPRRKILDGEKEARLIATACGKPPEGYSRWTMQLLADKIITLKVVDNISRETVRRSLKKTNLNHT